MARPHSASIPINNGVLALCWNALVKRAWRTGPPLEKITPPIWCAAMSSALFSILLWAWSDATRIINNCPMRSSRDIASYRASTHCSWARLSLDCSGSTCPLAAVKTKRNKNKQCNLFPIFTAILSTNLIIIQNIAFRRSVRQNKATNRRSSACVSEKPAVPAL